MRKFSHHTPATAALSAKLAGLGGVAASTTAVASRLARGARLSLRTLSGPALDIAPCAGALYCAYKAFTLLPASDRAELLKPFVWWRIPTGSVWGVLAGWDVVNAATFNAAVRPALLVYAGLGGGLAVLSNVFSYERQRPSNVTAWAAVVSWSIALTLSLTDIDWLANEAWFWRGASVGGQPAALILRMAEAGSLIAALCYQMPLAFNRVSPQHAQPVSRIMWPLFYWVVVAATLIPMLWPFFGGLIGSAYRALLHAHPGADRASSWAVLAFYLLIAWVTVGALALKPIKLLWSVVATLLLTRPLIPSDMNLFKPAHRGSR